MEDFNTYEYGAQQKSEGRWRLFKLLLISAYVLYAAAYFVAIYLTRIFPLGALIPLTLWIIIYFTWRYTSPDYKNVIEKGTMTFLVAYSKKQIKTKFSLKISAAEAIQPMDVPFDSDAHRKVYSALPSMNESDKYAAYFKNEKGEDCVFYFVATEQALKLLRLYNSKTVVTKTVR